MSQAGIYVNPAFAPLCSFSLQGHVLRVFYHTPLCATTAILLFMATRQFKCLRAVTWQPRVRRSSFLTVHAWLASCVHTPLHGCAGTIVHKTGSCRFVIGSSTQHAVGLCVACRDLVHDMISSHRSALAVGWHQLLRFSTCTCCHVMPFLLLVLSEASIMRIPCSQWLTFLLSTVAGGVDLHHEDHQQAVECSRDP